MLDRNDVVAQRGGVIALTRDVVGKDVEVGSTDEAEVARTRLDFDRYKALSSDR